MNSREMYLAINNIDDDLIENAKNISAKKPIQFKRLLYIAACIVILVGSLLWFGGGGSVPTQIDLTNRIVVIESSQLPEFAGSSESSNSITSDVAVNIEGVITKVGADGLSFRLDSGKWVYITDDTQIGKICTSQEEKQNLLFEPTFRVGNSISGFAKDNTSNNIVAYAIYTNWNFSQPLR